MGINNLHSLFGGRWFIEEQYGQSLLPSLFSILNGRTLTPSVIKSPQSFISTKAGVISANNFDSDPQKDNYVLVIPVKDPVYKYDQECGPSGTKTKQRIMARHENDPACKGVVLDIDSGGGQVSGTPEFYDFVKNYSKPVVAYTDGVMCSAAYYIGSAADHIIANKRADAIGSIGTMIHFIDLTGAYEKLGAKVITEYATKSTEKNKDFEDLIKGDPKGYIKNVLDPITDDFHKDMKAVRQNLKDEVLKGGTFGSEASLKNGLIDEIGTIQTAIDKVFSLSEKNNSNKNLNNSNKITMSKLNVPLIEAALGAPFSEGETENGILLTDAQAQAIETLLAQNAKAVEDATATIANLENAAKTATADATAVQTAIQNALATAEVADAATLNNVEGVAALSALVAEYGANDGAKPTNTPPAPDNKDTDSNVVSGVDLSTALNC